MKTSHRVHGEDVLNLPSGGLVHIAHAMLTESVRREFHLMSLSTLSSGRSSEELNVKELELQVRVFLNQFLDQNGSSLGDEFLRSFLEDPRSGVG